MSDLIERQTAIDAVEHITSSMSVCVNTDECHGMKRMQRQAVIELANLPSAQPEPQWIPVEERLPKQNEMVLIMIIRKDERYNKIPFISIGYISWNNTVWWCAHDGDCKSANVEVLAWMPLPEPYRAERRTDE